MASQLSVSDTLVFCFPVYGDFLLPERFIAGYKTSLVYEAMQEATIAACSFSRTFNNFLLCILLPRYLCFFMSLLFCFRYCRSSGTVGSPVWKRKRKNSSRP